MLTNWDKGSCMWKQQEIFAGFELVPDQHSQYKKPDELTTTPCCSTDFHFAEEENLEVDVKNKNMPFV